MKLRHLYIQGFKSFADKLDLDFADGITIFIGPNGSGKSNISDAIRWVLGEQNPRLLRSTKMDDVIFSGSEGRRSLGYAEVALTFDNSDRQLPCDYDEVTVSRRVYKSGESEFQINKTNCRLKDIRELFMDTGIGREGYSVIGQGRIESILNSKAEDRRTIFEEASGITKFRTRKEEAEKKLNIANDNLARIRDIIYELESQMDMLSQEADKAKRYIILRDELQELEVGIYVDSIRILLNKAQQYEIKVAQLEQDIENCDATKQELLERRSSFGTLEQDCVDRLDNAKAQLHEVELGLEAAKGQRNLSYQKMAETKGAISKAEEEARQYSDDMDRINAELANFDREIGELEAKALEAKERLAAKNKELSELTAAISQRENINAGVSDRHARLNAEVGLIGNRLTAIDTERQGNLNRLGTLAAEIAGADAAIKAGQTQLADAQTKLDSYDSKLTSAQNKIEALIDSKNDIANKLELQKAELKRVNDEYQGSNARLRTLKEMENSMEGYQRSVKNLMTACNQSRSLGTGVLGTVSELIRVDKTYETAIEFVLGNSLQDVVTETDQDAKRCIEYLRSQSAGRVTFLPINTVKTRMLEKEFVGRIGGHGGYVGIAADLVESAPNIRPVVQNLLGRIVVARDLSSAMDMARKCDYNFKIVTLEGDIVNAGGAMTGGSKDTGAGRGFLSRKREIQELTQSTQGMAGRIANANADQLRLETQLRNADKDLAAATEQYRSIHTDRAVMENSLRSLQVDSDREIARRDQLADERQQITEANIRLDAEQQEAKDKMTQLNRELAEVVKEIEAYGRQARSELEAKEAMTRDSDSIRSELEKLEIITLNVLHNKEREQIQLNSVLENMGQVNKAKQAAMEALDRIEDSIDQQELEIDRLLAAKAESESNIARLTEERDGLSEEFNKLNQQIESNDEAKMTFVSRLNRAQADSIRQQAELETVRNRLWDQYNLTYETSEGQYKVPENMAAARKRVDTLREQIRSMGDVNVTAIDQYAANMERLRFLKDQESDVVESGEKLRKIISEVAAQMKEQFVSQFQLINDSFSHVFSDLFGGGRAYVELTDNTNVLESGVEIIVQLPGKKLQNMNLMSGGERALTAIALLFGILRLKPSPFCLLDEIEAALDEVNVSRFSNYLQNCADDTQFLIITHRRGTMEIANYMYGVTMQEPGVSKIVSMKIKE